MLTLTVVTPYRLLKLGFVVIFPPALLPSFPGIGCAEQSLQQPECPVGFVEHPHPKA